jgi:hypothetical protein
MGAMRHVQALVLALLGGAVAGGCSTARPEQTPAHVEARAHEDGPGGDDGVLLDVAVIERPYGDRLLNYELWQMANEQAVDLERKPVLEVNGFRICQLGGLPPTGLQALLTSPRSCPTPRRMPTLVGAPAALLLGSVWPRCAFHLTPDGRATTELAYNNAQCLLEVVPTLAEEGRVQLRFTPHIRHGRPSMLPGATRDVTGTLEWNLQTQQPEEEYAALDWELTVAPGEFVVVGTWLDRADTLGQRCFLPADGEPRKQLLLVLRATRAAASPAADEAIPRTAPLALQAGLVSVRGSSE